VSISDSVSAALKKASLKQNDLAAAYGKSKQSMSMKFTRDSWFGKDLVKVAKLIGADLAFVFPDGSKIMIDTDDPDE
jgi:hypothetical protein